MTAPNMCFFRYGYFMLCQLLKENKFNTFDLRFFSVVVQSNHMVTIDFGETSDVSKKNCGFISNIISGTLTPNGKFFKAL